MRRENVRERSSHFTNYGNKGRTGDYDQGERRLSDDRRDYRDNLFLVFIGNLNPKVDVACLWGVFKVFGRVRDVFLFAKVRARSSYYAFVRFDTIEEASKVAKMVHGMHVYGWPINAKMADHGWKKRRSSEVVKNSLEKKGSFIDSDRPNDGGSVDSSAKEELNHRSYADILKGEQVHHNRRADKRKIHRLSMSWKKQKTTVERLSRCAIDWWTPKGKLSWINAVGIPMSCWEEAFFLKLGSLFGEMLWIDKETLTRKRLDQAKFLALIPHDWHNSFSTKIIMEESSFEVKIEVDPNPVSSSWLNQILDLEETLSESHFLSEFSKKSHTFSDLASQDGNVRVGADDGRQYCHTRKPSHPIVLKKGMGRTDKGSLNVKCHQPKAVRFQKLVVGSALREIDKGKGPWVRVQRPKELPLFYQNAKIIIGKSKCQGSQKGGSCLYLFFF
ncbi:hypothetical protein Q3G72_023053 [Acer saccharum]|nr:hypothetical protein Q3G72_023053 [Acer saccharum]